MTLNIFLGMVGPWQIVIIVAIFILVVLLRGIVRIINNKSKQSSLGQLEKLAELKQKGIITEEEFNKQKSKLLEI